MSSSDQLGVDLTLSNRRMNELAVVAGDEILRAHAIRNYELLLIKFNAEQDAAKRERILPILRAQQEWLVKSGISVPELEIYFPE
jgi:hypothetical protein